MYSNVDQLSDITNIEEDCSISALLNHIIENSQYGETQQSSSSVVAFRRLLRETEEDERIEGERERNCDRRGNNSFRGFAGRATTESRNNSSAGTIISSSTCRNGARSARYRENQHATREKLDEIHGVLESNLEHQLSDDENVDQSFIGTEFSETNFETHENHSGYPKDFERFREGLIRESRIHGLSRPSFSQCVRKYWIRSVPRSNWRQFIIHDIYGPVLGHTAGVDRYLRGYSSIRPRRHGLFIVAEHGQHFHVLHDCSYHSGQCRCSTIRNFIHSVNEFSQTTEKQIFQDKGTSNAEKFREWSKKYNYKNFNQSRSHGFIRSQTKRTDSRGNPIRFSKYNRRITPTFKYSQEHLRSTLEYFVTGSRILVHVEISGRFWVTNRRSENIP